LLPGQPKEAVDGSCNAEYQRRKPESVDSICGACANGLVRVLQGRRRNGGEKCRDGREVQKIARSVLLREADSWNTCTTNQWSISK
jgi:hypothetical protein